MTHKFLDNGVWFGLEPEVLPPLVLPIQQALIYRGRVKNYYKQSSCTFLVKFIILTTNTLNLSSVTIYRVKFLSRAEMLLMLRRISNLSSDFLRQFFVERNADQSLLELGANFSHRYAGELGLDWAYVYDVFVKDLGIKKLRIPTYWDELEKIRYQFDWNILDQILRKAELDDVLVVLTVGHRSPRWPECYCPSWAVSFSDDDFMNALFVYIDTVISHTSRFSCIEAFQIENEPFETKWGINCRNTTQILQCEIDIVKKRSPLHPVVLTYPSVPWMLSRHQEIINIADIAGVDVYNKIWFKSSLYQGYLKLLRMGIFAPLSLKYQRFLAKKSQKELWVAELQAEPWGPASITSELSEAECLESMSPSELEHNIKYVQDSGISRAYLWGIEWWIFERDVRKNYSMWDAGKDMILKINSEKD